MDVFVISSTLITFIAFAILVKGAGIKRQGASKLKEGEDLEKQTSVLEKEFVSLDLNDEIKKVDAQTAGFKEKTKKGKTVYDALRGSINKITAPLNHIKHGLYPPVYTYDDSEELKSLVASERARQFTLIKGKRATSSNSNWTWFGSTSKGEEMLKAYNHLALTTFNAEFDVIRKQMRATTNNTASDKLHRLVEQLIKLGETANVAITSEYVDAKKSELDVWYDEMVRKAEQKEERKRHRALMKERMTTIGKGSEESEEDEEALIGECENELTLAKEKASELAGRERALLELQIEAIKAERQRLENKFERMQSQAQITKAGYIYVISNIGSFGEGVVKIGMTRRLEPMDRVRELGDASVPFRFDTHTLAFVEDAPKVERALHKIFHKERVNTANFRKEFFRIPPEVVQAAMKKMEITSDWYFSSEAREFRESDQMREVMKQEKHSTDRESETFPVSI